MTQKKRWFMLIGGCANNLLAIVTFILTGRITMIILRNLAILCASSALVACATTPTPDPTPDPFEPAVSGTSGEDAGVYSVTQDGTTTTMAGASNAWTNGLIWFDNLSELETWGHETGDVLALAGRDYVTGDTHAGISGNLATSIESTGTASYAGGWGALYDNGGGTNNWAYGDFTTDVDFGSGEVSGTGTGNYASTLTIAGDIDGVQFNGTASFVGDNSGGILTVPMTGGFYGTDALAGIYQGADIAGLFHGINP